MGDGGRRSSASARPCLNSRDWIYACVCDSVQVCVCVCVCVCVRVRVHVCVCVCVQQQRNNRQRFVSCYQWVHEILRIHSRISKPNVNSLTASLVSWLQMTWCWNMGPSRLMKRAFMEQVAVTGELCRGLESLEGEEGQRRGRWGGVAEGSGNEGEGEGEEGEGRRRREKDGERESEGSNRPVQLFIAPQ